MKLQTGDWLFLKGHGLIEKATFSKIRHVGIVFDETSIFETDLKTNARINPLRKYLDKPIDIARPKNLTPRQAFDIKLACAKYKGAPYSYLDIGLNTLFIPLHPWLRKKLIVKLGNKKYMICSELVARISYEVLLIAYLKDFEGFQPVDLHEFSKASRELFDFYEDVELEVNPVYNK